MGKLTITLTLTDDEADALVELLARGLCHTTYNPTLAHHGVRVQDYVTKRIDTAVIARGRKVTRSDNNA